MFSIKGNLKARINLGVAGLPLHSFAKSGKIGCPKREREKRNKLMAKRRGSEGSKIGVGFI